MHLECFAAWLFTCSMEKTLKQHMNTTSDVLAVDEILDPQSLAYKYSQGIFRLQCVGVSIRGC